MVGALLLLSWYAGVSVQPPLPLSLRQDQLAACAPITLEAAEDCLRHALAPADLAIVQDRILARQFRPGLDYALERAWRLRDRTSPMAKTMHALLGVDQADFAAGMIISDLQVRAANPAGIGLNFTEIAVGLKRNPLPPEDPLSPETSPPQEMPHAD